MVEKKILTKEEILGVTDLPVKEIDVPEWNGVVCIRGLNAQERDEFEEHLFVGEGKDRKMNLKNIRARLISMCVCDENGGSLFTHEDILTLGKKNARVVNRIFAEAQSLSGLGNEDIKDAIKN
jgi:hypothetical protein